MSAKAHITDLEALERLRSALVLYLERVHGVLDEVGEEVKRTRSWLQSEQPLRLGQAMKRKQRELELLEQELFTARLSGLREAKTGLQMKVARKRREIADLEGTMRRVAKWSRDYDSVVALSARKVEKLRSLLDIEGGQGVRRLGESIRLLSDYASSAPLSTGGTAPPGEANRDGQGASEEIDSPSDP